LQLSFSHVPLFHAYTHICSIKGLKSTQIQILQEDAQTMEFLCGDHFLACVVGKHDWKQWTKKEIISQVATISDEAFALLIWKTFGMNGKI